MKKKSTPNCLCCNPFFHILSDRITLSRRFFLLGTGTFVATVLAQSTQASKAQIKPSNLSPQNNPLNDNIADKIYVGEIITVCDAQPTAEAIALKNGKILAVGKRDEVMAFKTDTTQVIELKDSVMVPGFFDGHGHVFNQGIAATVADLLPAPDGNVDSIPKLQQVLSEWSQANGDLISTFGWIVGMGYDDSQLKEQRHPVKEELDSISTEFPILIMHQSGHLAAVNSKALEILEFTASTENPAGGIIRRVEGTKEPDGVLEENAAWMAMTKFGTPNEELILSFAAKGAQIYASFGFTTAQEGRASQGTAEGLMLAAQKEQVPIDINIYVDYLAHPNAHTWKWSQDTHTNHVRLARAKLNLDGSPQGKTAWLTEPYYIPPEGQDADYKGYLSVTDEQVIDRISTAFTHNFQIQAHCNGDAAIDQYINAVKKVTETKGKGKGRTVAIHAQTAREDQLDQMKELGIFPAFFPSHTFYWGDWHYESVLGAARAERIYPTRSALNRGMMFSSHNDAPVVLPNAMRLLWSVVNRRTRTDRILGEEQQVTPLEGLKSLTIWPAYQHFEEDSKGSLEVGKLADLAILSANPLTVDRTTINQIEVLETIKEGSTVYCKQV